MISPFIAVCCGDYPVLIYQRSPAKVLTLCCLYWHNVLDWMWNWCISSHYTLLRNVQTCNTHRRKYRWEAHIAVHKVVTKSVHSCYFITGVTAPARHNTSHKKNNRGPQRSFWVSKSIKDNIISEIHSFTSRMSLTKSCLRRTLPEFLLLI